MSSNGGPGSRTEDELPRIGQWKNFQNPHPELPNPHLSQKTPVSLTKEELRVLQECNRESFWYRSIPACLFCVGITQIAVNKGYLKPHPKYGAGLKTLGAALLGYILGKISYQNECRKKIMALPNSQLAETLRQRISRESGPSESTMKSVSSDMLENPQVPQTEHTASDVFDTETNQVAPSTVKFEDLSSGNSGEQESQYRSYGDLRRQNREIYNENQIVKWQNMQNKTRNPQPNISQTPEEKSSQWTPSYSTTQPRAPTNKYGDVWEE